MVHRTQRTVAAQFTLAWTFFSHRMIIAIAVAGTATVLSQTRLHAQTAPTSSQPSIESGEALLARVESALMELTERVAPSVVSIHAERPLRAAPKVDSDATQRSWLHTGSGVVISSDGQILTSEHVIHEAIRITVTLHDGRRFRASIVAADRRSDLAVLRVEATDLKAAELGDADGVRRGQLVVALGNPLGLSPDGHAAVTHGIISAVNRSLPRDFGREDDRFYGDLIQTSAAIQPGNSGGPLVNIHGQVIGIVAAVTSRSADDQGFGFAVPMDARIRDIIARLSRGQEIEYGFFGIEIRTAAAGDQQPGGAFVERVLDGPARTAGLLPGDLITAFNDLRVLSADALLQKIGAARPGVTASVALIRAGRPKTLHIDVARRSFAAMPAESTPQPIAWRGATIDRVNRPLREQARLLPGALWITAVEPDSAAARGGLTPGDIIVEINGVPLDSVETGTEALRDAKDAVTIRLMNGRMRRVAP